MTKRNDYIIDLSDQLCDLSHLSRFLNDSRDYDQDAITILRANQYEMIKSIQETVDKLFEEVCAKN